MSSPETYEAFKSVLDAGWTDSTLVYENDFYETTGAPFVFVEIFGDTFNQESIGAPGANLWVETGSTLCHVMIKAGEGSGGARDDAKAISYLFREQPVDGIKITEMSSGAGAPGRDFPGYWAFTLAMYWSRDDITSLPSP